MGGGEVYSMIPKHQRKPEFCLEGDAGEVAKEEPNGSGLILRLSIPSARKCDAMGAWRRGERHAGAKKARNLLVSSAIVALCSGGALADSVAAAETTTAPSLQLAQVQPEQPPGPGAAPEPGEPPAGAVEKADESDAAGPTSADAFINEQGDTEWLASELVGANVQNLQGESIGRVTNLVLDEEGQVIGVVVGVGGFLGMGRKHVGVKLDAVEPKRYWDNQLEVVMDATREALAEAPDFVDLAQIRGERDALREQPSGYSPPSISRPE